MDTPDILIFFSDQHNADMAGYSGNKIVRTPNLDRLSKEGIVFDNAYTSCPLCVPARVSFMTGRLCCNTGVFDNYTSIDENMVTFMHSIAAAGYETVLCGRMHFMGENQRHGFTRRIAGEFTPRYAGDEERRKLDLGYYYKTTTNTRCLEVVGGSPSSPVLEYDEMVINNAVEYLTHNHKKPQCIVVGTYGPHYPYVAPLEKYTYYREIVDAPYTFTNSIGDYPNHPLLRKYERYPDIQTAKRARAAYYGMIERIDSQLGEVKAAWDKYLKRNKREGISIYLSDHGDMNGEHNMYGKMTFYEGSAKIPLIIEGSGFAKGRRIETPVSIVDIGATLCEIVNADLPPQIDGKSLLKYISVSCQSTEPNSYVISEFMEKDKFGRNIPGRMIRKGKWKYIRYHTYEDYDLLFDVENDRYEVHNRKNDFPEKASELAELLSKDWDVEKIAERYSVREANTRILTKWILSSKPEDREIWHFSEDALKPPQIN
jgi:choline-sulfatase